MAHKPSWDVATSPIYGKDTLILGVPGSGYETFIEKGKRAKLPIFNIGDMGYRPSSLYPSEWNINLDSCFSTITSPWNKPRIYVGYANNWLAMIRLPWHKVFYYLLPNTELARRISAYRASHGLDDLEGPDGAERVSERLLAIAMMLEASGLPTLPALPDDPREVLKYLNVKPKQVIPDDIIQYMRKHSIV